MDFSKLRIKIDQNNGHFDVMINLGDAFSEEFGLDFFSSFNKENRVELVEHIKEKYRGLNLRFGKITAGGVLIAIFAVSSGGAVSASPPNYNVQAGDTIQTVSKAYGISIEDIMTVNSLEREELEPGQGLLIPGISDNKPTKTRTAPTIHHTVKSGDTLWLLAKAYNTSIEEIREINNLKTGDLQLGQHLVLPKPDTAESPKVHNAAHVVKKRETLWTLAKTYGTTVDAIKSLNNLRTDEIGTGQILVIPKAESVMYTVKAGDTLWLIAAKFGTTSNLIKTENKLESDNLEVGRVLKITDISSKKSI